MRQIRGIAAAIAAGIVLGSIGKAEELGPQFAGASDEISLAELDRRAAVERQVQLNDAMRWRAGFPPANGVFYYPLPGNLESIYGYGAAHRFGPSVFTPWPYVPGDIWGYRNVPPSRQSIGQVQVQTGPNRWESRPVYATPPREAPLSPVVRDELPPAAPLLPAERIAPSELMPPDPDPREF
jgi:hypothetical protein